MVVLDSFFIRYTNSCVSHPLISRGARTFTSRPSALSARGDCPIFIWRSRPDFPRFHLYLVAERAGVSGSYVAMVTNHSDYCTHIFCRNCTWRGNASSSTEEFPRLVCLDAEVESGNSAAAKEAPSLDFGGGVATAGMGIYDDKQNWMKFGMRPESSVLEAT